MSFELILLKVAELRFYFLSVFDFCVQSIREILYSFGAQLAFQNVKKQF